MLFAAADSYERSKKVEKIFERFDFNHDGRLNKSEMSALVVAVNPRVKFSDDQISSILDEVFRTYSEYIEPDAGLSLNGLKRTYDDGAGDVNRDFAALGFSLESTDSTEHKKDDDSITLQMLKAPRFFFISTRCLLDDLEMILARHNEMLLDEERVLDSAYILSRELEFLRERADEEPASAAFEAHMYIGRGLMGHGLQGEAVESFWRAVHIHQKDVRGHFLCGSALYALGKRDEAKREFEIALENAKLDPPSNSAILPQVHVNLGIAFEAEGMLINACAHYQEALILNPHHFRTLKLLGSALYALGDFSASAKALENAVFINPDYADAHCELGTTLHAKKDEMRARQEYEKAIEIEPNHVEALYNLAGLYRSQGMFGMAVERYDEVLKLDPKSWKAELNKGISLLGCGNGAEAMKSLQRALQMTNRVELYDAVGRLTRVSKKKKKRKSLSSPGEKAAGTEPADEAFASDVAEHMTVDGSLIEMADGKCCRPEELLTALDIRGFQRATRLNRVPLEKLRELFLTVRSNEGGRKRVIRKPTLEKLLRKLVDFLEPETFQEAIRAMNEKVISKLADNGNIDARLFASAIALLCSGSVEERRAVAFDALMSRRSGESGGISRGETESFVELLKAIFLAGFTPPAVPFRPVGGLFTPKEFAAAIDTAMPIWKAVLKVESHDRYRHTKHVCVVCSYTVVGLRYRETQSRFDLCSRCFSECKVPVAFKATSYTFKELPA